MKLKVIIPCLILVSTPVFGTNYGNNGKDNTNINSVSSSNRVDTNNINSAHGGKATSMSFASGGNSYASGGKSKSSAYSGGNTQSVSIVENGNTHYSGSYDVRTVGNAPDVMSYSTAPCRVAIGASGGWLGGAFGFTGSVLDDGCDIWRDVVNLTAHNYKDAADMRLCDKPELKKVLAHCNAMGYTEVKEEKMNPFNVH